MIPKFLIGITQLARGWCCDSEKKHTEDRQVKCVEQERRGSSVELKESTRHLSEDVQQAVGEIGVELRRKEWARNINYMFRKCIVCH